MSVYFTKLFSSITESTVWREPDHVRLVWITMLAMADRRGRVWGSVPGLADRARVSIESTVQALEKFQAPDPWSRTQLYEGKRIEVIRGGWRLLNYDYYRSLRDDDERREYERQKKRVQRQKAATIPNELHKAAQHVMTSCAISDPRMLRVIANAIAGTVGDNRGHATIAGQMISAFQDYKNAAEFLRFTVGLRKFFGHGLWCDSKLWPIDQDRLNQWRRVNA